MTDPRPPARKPIAGGAPLALCLIVGAVVGGLYGQPSIGLLIGLGTGLAIGLAIWWRDRER
ncbi:hypothetical protein [Sphingomonas sp. 37zxx]|uniref:hypothetical protein n=1 Tax=Sphingomonas sp. 37zxx TaxID=1550073 RepID=UPI00053BE6A5|nr:hypothetical protein [Sphingomonas sp. 37zxx]